MLQELIHRLVSKKLFAAMSAALMASALVVLSMFFSDKETTVAIITFIGAPSFGALAYFVHAQGKVDQIESAH